MSAWHNAEFATKSNGFDGFDAHLDFNTIMAVHRELPAKLIMPSTGTRVVFGA